MDLSREALLIAAASRPAGSHALLTWFGQEELNVTADSAGEVVRTATRRHWLRGAVSSGAGGAVAVAHPPCEPTALLRRAARAALPAVPVCVRLADQAALRPTPGPPRIGSDECVELVLGARAALTGGGPARVRVRIRSRVRARIHADSEGAVHEHREVDEVVTLTAWRGNSFCTLQRPLESLRHGDMVARFAERWARLASAAPGEASGRQVVMAPSVAAALIHEAVGHQREADLGGAGAAGAPGRFHPDLFVTDDPRAGGTRAGYDVDDEGVRASEVVLLRAGEPVGWLHSLRSAAAYRAAPTGHGRVGGPTAFAPPRQCAIALRPGSGTAADFCASVSDGVLLDGHALGRWTERTLVIEADGGRRIRGGRAAEDVGPVRLELTPLQAIGAIAAVGEDLETIDHYSCAKGTERLPLRFVVPALLVRPAT